MKILYVEPYYTGSHKQWIDSYIKGSKHKIDLLTLRGIHWKWRMHGAAITLADRFHKIEKCYNLIIVSDMLNLPLFKSLCSNKLKKTKVIIYFHENQFSYPRSENDEDMKLERDLHYHFINYSSALVSDYIFFNSYFHLNDFMQGLKKYLNKMPDYKNFNTIDIIKDKSSVLYIGNNLSQFENNDIIINDKPIILWNHRWEHDKNPESFFKIVIKLSQNKVKFSLVVLGENFKNSPKCFETAKIKLKKEILFFGYCKDVKEYYKWLNKADILPVTSHQDFFGLSIVEAVHARVYPLLPNRLSYPEIFNIDRYPEIFYQTENELYDKLVHLINHYKKLRKSTLIYKEMASRFDWSIMADIYDETFEKIYNN